MGRDLVVRFIAPDWSEQDARLTHVPSLGRSCRSGIGRDLQDGCGCRRRWFFVRLYRLNDAVTACLRRGWLAGRALEMAKLRRGWG